MGAIYKREMTAFFTSPTGYVFSAIFFLYCIPTKKKITAAIKNATTNAKINLKNPKSKLIIFPLSFGKTYFFVHLAKCLVSKFRSFFGTVPIYRLYVCLILLQSIIFVLNRL